METSTSKSFKLLENVIFLKKTSLFSTMKTSELRAVASIIEEVTFKKDDNVVREGELGDSMYIIKNGIVRITKNINDNKNIELAELESGDCFGDMAIFDAEVRSASVVAKNKCVLLRLDSDGLIDVLNDYPSIAVELIKIFVQRLRKANKTIQELSDNTGGNTDNEK